MGVRPKLNNLVKPKVLIICKFSLSNQVEKLYPSLKGNQSFTEITEPTLQEQ